MSGTSRSAAPRNSWQMLLLTFGNIGFLSTSPGTLASAVAALLLYPMRLVLPGDIDGRFLIVLGIGMLVFSLALKAIEQGVRGPDYDQSYIVIDEVLGIGIALLPVFFIEVSLLYVVCTFIIFRFFDIAKPFGIASIDARKTPESVLVDDVVAGLYTLLLTVWFVQA